MCKDTVAGLGYIMIFMWSVINSVKFLNHRSYFEVFSGVAESRISFISFRYILSLNMLTTS